MKSLICLYIWVKIGGNIFGQTLKWLLTSSPPQNLYLENKAIEPGQGLETKKQAQSSDQKVWETNHREQK